MIDSFLYVGQLRHRRYTPRLHCFSYPIEMFCFDIADIKKTFNNHNLISFKKFNWYSYRRKDYLRGDDVSLDSSARKLVNEKLNFYPTGKIFLLTNLATLGYCFNPISLYFVFNDTGNALVALIIEVTNTPWKEKHTYVLNKLVIKNNNLYRYHFKKELHVSPFMEMHYEYDFNLKISNQQIIVHMKNMYNNKCHFDASLSLNVVKKSEIDKTLWQYRLMNYKVSAAIYWQALKLFLKRIPFYSHPSR